jgi:hypothetical protein
VPGERRGVLGRRQEGQAEIDLFSCSCGPRAPRSLIDSERAGRSRSGRGEIRQNWGICGSLLDFKLDQDIS